MHAAILHSAFIGGLSIDWFPVRLSFMVATAATLIALVAGSTLAWLLARKRFPGRDVIDALVSLPGIPMSVVQSVIPISSVLILVAEIAYLVELVQARDPRELQPGTPATADALH